MAKGVRIKNYPNPKHNFGYLTISPKSISSWVANKCQLAMV